MEVRGFENVRLSVEVKKVGGNGKGLCLIPWFQGPHMESCGKKEGRER